jgi:hypothetical protein
MIVAFELTKYQFNLIVRLQMKTLKIFQTFHKNYPRPPDVEWIQPIGVNGYKFKESISDGSGDNISVLNPFYCELTAMYWAWKNDKSEILGFYHYRRYLNLIVDQTWLSPPPNSMPPNPDTLAYLAWEQQRIRIEKLLDVFDIIVPRSYAARPSVEGQYRGLCQQEPWDLFMHTVADKYPKSKPYLGILNTIGYFPACNIFITKRPLFEKYCESLFPVIDSIYSKIGHPYDAQQNRYPGFLAERFLGIWMYMEGLKSVEVQLIQIG